MTEVGQGLDAFAALNAEWARLEADSCAAERVAGWLSAADALPPEGGREGSSWTLEELLRGLEREDRRQGRAYSDLWLGVLLARAVGKGEDAQLAARVVMQAMLPSAARTARSLMRSDGRQFTDVAQVVVACLYQRVRCYPLSRRPRRFAANLAMDTLKLSRRELLREWEPDGEELDDGDGAAWAVGAFPGPDEQAYLAVLAETAGAVGLSAADLSVEELAGARAEVVELLLWALGEQVVSLRDARVVSEHFRDGGPCDVVAARAAGVAPATLRQWRSRAVRRLRREAPRCPQVT